jgi:hypothetical protein
VVTSTMQILYVNAMCPPMSAPENIHAREPNSALHVTVGRTKGRWREDC